MKSWKKPLKFLVLLLIIVIGLVGCRTAKRPINERTKTITEKTTPVKPETVPKTTTETVPGKTETAVNERQKIEKDIAKEVEKVKDVEKATVLINDRTAYVGIELPSNLAGKEKEIDKIKTEVMDKVKKRDTNITTVHVSSEEHVVTKLKEYARDVERGKPITTFVKDIEEMFRMPVSRR